MSLPFPALGQAPQDQQTLGSPSETYQAARLAPIIVHSQKREEDLLTVPASIAVVDGQTLAEEDAYSLEALSGMVSGLSFQDMGQSGLMPPSSAA